MYDIDIEYDLTVIGVHKKCSLSTTSTVTYDDISLYNTKNHKLYTYNNTLIGNLYLNNIIGDGSYGWLYLSTFHINNIDYVHIVKRPKLKEMNLVEEAIIQHISKQILQKYLGNSFSIPTVYTIFKLHDSNTTWFSMEYIRGITTLDWIIESTNIDNDFFIFMAQISLILKCLYKYINLDHRDLKLNNILIIKESCRIEFKLNDYKWILYSPFKIIILDFGFACIGSLNAKNTLINLGNGIIPDIDPCPKEGRDLFHLLVSFCSTKEFTDKISLNTKTIIDRWLIYKDKSFGITARKWCNENWVYLLTGDTNFKSNSSNPKTILNELLTIIPDSLIKMI